MIDLRGEKIHENVLLIMRYKFAYLDLDDMCTGGYDT